MKTGKLSVRTRPYKPSVRDNQVGEMRKPSGLRTVNWKYQHKAEIVMEMERNINIIDTQSFLGFSYFHCHENEKKYKGFSSEKVWDYY